MRYTPEQRSRIAQESVGKVIESFEWDDVDCYWVISFTDGTELCVRLMAEENTP